MTAKTPKKPAPIDDTPQAFNIRGVTAADDAALSRAVARREKTAPPGAKFTRGSVLLALIRAALAAEDAADAASEGKP